MAEGLSLCDCLFHPRVGAFKTVSGPGVFTAAVIGILAGWIAEWVLKRRHDLFTNLIVGVIGSFLGAFIAGRLNIPIQGLVASFVVSTLGALLLLSVLVLLGRR